MKYEFALGETAVIIGNSNGHCFKIGEEVILHSKYTMSGYKGQIFFARRPKGIYDKHSNVVRDYDMVPLRKMDTIDPDE